MKNDYSNDDLLGQILKKSFTEMENEADFSLSAGAGKGLFDRLSLISPYATPTGQNGELKNNKKSVSDRKMVRSFYYAASSLWKVVVPIAALVIVIGGSGIYIKNNKSQGTKTSEQDTIALMETEGGINQKLNPGEKLNNVDEIDAYAMLAEASNDWASEEESAYEGTAEESELVFSDMGEISRFNENEDEF